MSTRAIERYICRGCSTFGTQEFRLLCPQCYADFLEVVELYQKVVREHPKARAFTMPELFRRLAKRGR